MVHYFSRPFRADWRQLFPFVSITCSFQFIRVPVLAFVHSVQTFLGGGHCSYFGASVGQDNCCAARECKQTHLLLFVAI